jgi:hypothetical protein
VFQKNLGPENQNFAFKILIFTPNLLPFGRAAGRGRIILPPELQHWAKIAKTLLTYLGAQKRRTIADYRRFSQFEILSSYYKKRCLPRYWWLACDVSRSRD